MTQIDVVASATIEGRMSRFLKTYQVDEARAVRSLLIPADSVDLEVDFAPGDYANLSFLMIFSDGPLTLRANDDSQGSPDWTATLTAADGDCIFLSGAGITCLKGTGLTKLFVSESGSVDRVLTCLSGGDITPTP